MTNGPHAPCGFPYTNVIQMLEYLQRVPWGLLDALRFNVRNRFATQGWPGYHDSIAVPLSTEDVQGRLRLAHWEDASGYSLKYENELLNMRRPAGFSAEYDHHREDHVRVREHPDPDFDGLELIAHREASRFLAMHDHTHETGLDWFTEDELRTLVSDIGL